MLEVFGVADIEIAETVTSATLSICNTFRFHALTYTNKINDSKSGATVSNDTQSGNLPSAFATMLHKSIFDQDGYHHEREDF